MEIAGVHVMEDRLLVRVDKPDAETESGILVVENEDRRQPIGEVVASGPDVDAIKKDDRVLFAKYAGTEITVDGEELTMLRQGDVILRWVG